IVFGRTGRHGQPRALRRTEPGVLRCVSLHGCAFTVAALLLRPPELPDGILHVFLANGISGPHADLFAVVHEWSRASGEKERRHELGDLIVVAAFPVAIPSARLSMIAIGTVGLLAGR